ncbi:MAG: hypothetical protein ACE5J9_09480 [Methanosarcinales archaeon]
MSTKVKLYFYEKINQELDYKIPQNGSIIKLTAGICFKTKNDWTDPYFGIVDTGAHISVIPRRIWSKSEVKVFAEHSMRGVVPLKECTVPVLVGEIQAKLIDSEENSTRKFTMPSYFALTNKIPLLIGFKKVIECFELYCNYPKKEAYVVG